MKLGRPRKFNYGDTFKSESAEAKWMLGMLLELGDRLFDQVVHLPSKTLHTAPPGSYLTPARLVLHCVGTEFRLLKIVLGEFADPGYAPLVVRTTSTDLVEMETESVDVVELLRAHLGFRQPLMEGCATEAGFLDRPLDHPQFADRRAVLGHLIWHWSFHSGHVGAVTLEMGYDYTWTSAQQDSPSRKEP